MKLDDILAKLDDEEKNFLVTALNTRDTRINELTTEGRSKEKELKEVQAAKKTIEALQTEVDSYKGKVKTYERRDTLSNFSKVANANSDVLMDLLPEDMQLSTKDIEIEGAPVTKAFVVVDGKEVDFNTYVDSDPRLKLYKPSIFTPVETPASKPVETPVATQPLVSLPRGADTTVKDANKTLSGNFFSQNYNPVLDRIKGNLK